MLKKIIFVSVVTFGLSASVLAKNAPACATVKAPAPACACAPKCAPVCAPACAPACAPVVDTTPVADVGASTDVSTSPSTICSVASVYIGAQGLFTDMNYDGSSYTLPRNSISSDNKWGFRGYAGYAFSEFLALELGYDYFGHPSIEDKITANVQDFTQQGMDLVAKAMLPLDYGFGVFIKGGGLWVHRSAIANRGGCFVDKDSSDKFTGIAGLGVSYNFAPNIGMDFGYSQTLSAGDLPKMNIFSLGLMYKINI